MFLQHRHRFRDLPRTVILLGVISLLADICSEMTYPILPLFLVGTLKAPEALIGVIEGVAESVVSLMRGWSGVHSDRLGRRLGFIRVGYLMSAIGKTAVGLANSWVMVLVARSLDRTGKGVRSSARDALLADSVNPQILGYAFGFHRAMDTAGAFLGVLIGILLISLMPGDYRTIFFLAAIPGALSVAATFWVQENAPAQVSRDLESEAVVKPNHWQIFRDLPIPTRWSLAALALFALGNTSDAFLLLRANELGFSNAAVLGFYLLYNLAVIITSTWAGHLSDHFGRLRVLVGGWVAFAVSYGGFAVASGQWIALPFCIYGLSFALTHGVSRAYLAEISPVENRAGTMGLFFMVTGIVTLMGNIGFGALWQSMGSLVALTSSVATAIGALAVMAIGFRSAKTSGS